MNYFIFLFIVFSGALSDELNIDEASDTSEQFPESSKNINNNKIEKNLATEYYQNLSPNTNPQIITAQNQKTYFPHNFEQGYNPSSNQFYQPVSYTHAPANQLGYGNVHRVVETPSANLKRKTKTSEPANVTPWLDFDGLSKPETIGEEIDELKLSEDIDLGQMPTDNILRNPSFEQSIIQDSLTGWLCQGDSNEPKSGLMTQSSSDHHGEGFYSGRCSNRVANWSGPGQYIGRFLKPSTNYKFSVWLRLETKDPMESTGIEMPVEIWLRYRERNKKKLNRKLLATDFHLVNDQRWKNIVGDFQIPSQFKRVKYVFLYINGPNANTDILIDDSKLTVLPKDENWKKKADRMKEKIRKRDVTIKLFFPPAYSPKDIATTTVQVKQTKNYFAFGAALSNRVLFDKTTSRRLRYKKFFLENFQWATLETAMKWRNTEPERGHVNYTIADELMDLLLTNNISVRGHSIFWALAGRQHQTKWLPGLAKPEFRDAMETRLDSIVSRYKSKVQHWDVNNEMLHWKYYVYKLNDSSIREWMFRKVREIDPKVKLFLNEYEVVASGLYTQAYVDLAKELQKKNVPIEGIGAQGHFTGVVDPLVFKDRLDTLKKIDLPIWLTEVDIVEKDPHKRAVSLENVMRVGFSHPSVHGIILWCFWNKACWRGPDTGLVDGDDFKLTEAGRVYMDLRRQWTTNKLLIISFMLPNEGIFKFRGFHGDYDMFIYLPNGNRIKKSFKLNPGAKELVVKVDIDEIYL